MEMQQVRYFVTLAEELNFTRAAERCHVSQPALTRAIRLLEAEFGGQLFNRERSRTHLSELGRMVLPHLREIYARADQAKREASELVDLTRASLRLGLMCTIAPASLLGLIKTPRHRICMSASPTVNWRSRCPAHPMTWPTNGCTAFRCFGNSSSSW